ncbi:hypothetical protein LINPERPRIM_LOCUS3093 [Linum perenne]
MALARRVFPVPGGPTRRTPFGIRAPIAVNLPGFLRNSTTSMKSCLASSTPATSSNVTPVLGSIWNLALDRPTPSGKPDPPGPPNPPGPERRERRNRPPITISGKAKLESKFKRREPESS